MQTLKRMRRFSLRRTLWAISITISLIILSSWLFIESTEPLLTVPCYNSTTPGQEKVILMSYMRAGSSYVGSLFFDSPDVYYYFEPLLYTGDEDIVEKGKPIRSRLSSALPYQPNPPLTLDFLLSLIRCDVTEHDMKFLHWLTPHLRKCQSEAYVMGVEYTQKCASDLIKRCQSASTVLAKVVRLKMWEVDALMNCQKDLKVIHLVRDPRAISNSRAALGFYFNPETFCQRVVADGMMTLDMQTEGRLLTVRYEDIVESPIEMSKILYKFAGIRWSSEIESELRQKTAAKNPHDIAFKWRTELKVEESKRIEKLCNVAMEMYGYISFSDDGDLRDLNQPSFLKTYSNLFYNAKD